MISTPKQYLGIVFLIIYGIALFWLAAVWYHSYTGFHWFDDFLEWEYLDKAGHFFASFHLGLFFYKVYGDPEDISPQLRRKWISFAGFILLLPIEVLDGFSLDYGASAADLLANGLGSIFCYAHVSGSVVSDIMPKFSFHTTTYSLLRPELLGSTFFQQTLKDYNGQTYWLSVDVNKVLNRKILPRWLMLTVGYGAEGLLGGHDNVWNNSDKGVVDYSAMTRAKRVFISLDLNPTAFEQRNKWANYLLAPFMLVKFPAPALEFNAEQGIIFHPVYF